MTTFTETQVRYDDDDDDVSFSTYQPTHLSDTSRDLATSTLEVTALVADAGLRAPSAYQLISS